MADEELVEIIISKKYYDEVKKVVSYSSQFQTVSEYVNFVLKELLFGNTDSERTEAEDEVIKKRLQDLGYT